MTRLTIDAIIASPFFQAIEAERIAATADFYDRVEGRPVIEISMDLDERITVTGRNFQGSANFRRGCDTIENALHFAAGARAVIDAIDPHGPFVSIIAARPDIHVPVILRGSYPSHVEYARTFFQHIGA